MKELQHHFMSDTPYFIVFFFDFINDIWLIFSFVELKWKIFGQFDRFLPPSLAAEQKKVHMLTPLFAHCNLDIGINVEIEAKQYTTSN